MRANRWSAIWTRFVRVAFGLLSLPTILERFGPLNAGMAVVREASRCG